MEQDAHTLHAVDSDRTGGPAAAAAVAAVAASAAEQSPHEKPWDKEFKQTFVGETVLVESIKCEHVHLLKVPHLREHAGAGAERPNLVEATSSALGEDISYRNLKEDHDCILADIVRHPHQTSETRAYLRAGPRPVMYFAPEECAAAIVTCGGLCPGLNNIIRELVLSLHNLYGVRKVYGVRDGYAGFSAPSLMELTPASVRSIHNRGGTILGSSRGGFEGPAVIDRLLELGVNQLYVIGGDGTHRGAQKLYELSRERGLPISVAGIPKTIDNDIDLVDRSFGFNTAVEEARRAIQCAKVEAMCAPNGIGFVKVMGRHAGFIAAHAALASGDVDLCLIPEVPIVLDGRRSCLAHLERVVARQGHAVVVVAEGAGEELLRGSGMEGQGVDASGNPKLGEIGPFLCKAIKRHLASVGQEASIKYIDPSYMIRSVPATASDSIFCMLLAQNAVHGAMSGFTGFTTALCNNRLVYLPITAIVRNSPRTMDPFGRTWERILSMTGQPDTADLLPRRLKTATTAKTIF